MNELVLHVGLMKSGTTSVQHALYAARLPLLEQGVEYIDVGQSNHMLSFVELLQRDPIATQGFPRGLQKHHREIRHVTDGMWNRLVGLVRASQARRVVLSAENLVYAGPGTVSRLRQAFADREVRVVITHRPASKLVPSNYQQQARVGTTGGFEEWCRAELAAMSRPTPAGSLASLRLSNLSRLWEPEVEAVTLVDTNLAPEESMGRMWQALTGLSAATVPAIKGSMNVSMSAEFTAALQDYIAWHPRLSVSEIREVGQLAYRRHQSRVGGPHFRWQLAEPLVELVDAACAPDAADASAMSLAAFLASAAWVGDINRLTATELQFTDLQRLAAKELRSADHRLRAVRAYRAARCRLRRSQ